MVRIEHVKLTPKPQPIRSPYDLVAIFINGVLMDGRPYEFEYVNGVAVSPLKVTTICPDCSAGLDVVLDEPNYFECPYCHPATQLDNSPTAELEFDPFINPFLDGAVILEDVNSDLISALGVSDISGTVAERMKLKPVDDSYIYPPEDDP